MTMLVPDALVEAAYPDLRDPRILVAVPRSRRAAMTALWAFAARLTRLLCDAREPLIAQIKLAWWRDMTLMVAKDPAALPRGEPLLAKLGADWAGRAGLDALVDAAEAVLLADDGESRRAAAGTFGAVLFALSAEGDVPNVSGTAWGYLWGAMLPLDPDATDALLCSVRNLERGSFAPSQRSLQMLDRWARTIAENGGERHWRREGWLLFRIGLLGR